MQARVAMCLAGVVVYILMPFDVLPEAFLGIYGLLDDLLVALALLITATIFYRHYVAHEQ